MTSRFRFESVLSNFWVTFAGSPKVTFESLFCVFEISGVWGSVGEMAGHKRSHCFAIAMFRMLEILMCHPCLLSSSWETPLGNVDRVQHAITLIESEDSRSVTWRGIQDQSPDKICIHQIDRGEKTLTPKISSSLRERPVLLRTNFVVTKDPNWPY